MVNYVLTGFRTGFDIGYNGLLNPIRRRNNRSARENARGVSEAVRKEVERGHTAGPFSSPPFAVNHISPLSAVPKPDGSTRLVFDLSQPHGESVNDFISKDEFPTSYTHFDTATELVHLTGKGCFLTKVDIKHAYRLLPVRPEDRPLLVYFWEGKYYVDLVLPFGGRSSASIFTSFSDLVCWILRNKRKLTIVHYSDDFLLISLTLEGALADLKDLKFTFECLNIPVAEDKLEGPATALSFCGINIDTEDMAISIPQDKVDSVMSEMPRWCSRRTCTQVQLQSLVGKFNFFAKAIIPGRIFTRRLIDLIHTVKRPNHHITITRAARADIHWWCDLLRSWNRSAIIPHPRRLYSTDLKLFSDAAKYHGFGAVCGEAWIQSTWPVEWAERDIDFKEFFAVYAAALTWGAQWAGRRVVMVTDNKAITQIWAKGSTPAPLLMAIVRKLFLFAAKNSFSISLKHIYGHFNSAADALSRFQMSRFREVAPAAQQQPTPIPEEVWDVDASANITHYHA
jgi:hypothetical protein